MLFRFSLYGFLKNQRYFEPFLILAFLDKGLSFFQIGLLIGFREVAVNVLEVPSGVVADLSGRRRAMVVSFAAYILSFVVFARAEHFAALFGAMALFACGDAFRSGTHKAMILEWLRLEGRTDERTRVYGYTRSWSKLGSATSALIAAGLVIATSSYAAVFWLSIVPYAANLVNLATYPAVLDGERRAAGPTAVIRHLRETLAEVWRSRPLRRLVGESMGYEGLYAVLKDYLQPVLKAAALALPILLDLEDERRTALLVGVVYFALNIFGSVASRKAHRVAAAAGGEDGAARALWCALGIASAALLASLALDVPGVAVVVFIALAILQNLWRPILVARFDTHSRAEASATTLSVEAQAKSLGAMILAPALGFTVDHVATAGRESATVLWPIAVPGILLALIFAITARKQTRSDD